MCRSTRHSSTKDTWNLSVEDTWNSFQATTSLGARTTPGVKKTLHAETPTPRSVEDRHVESIWSWHVAFFSSTLGHFIYFISYDTCHSPSETCHFRPILFQNIFMLHSPKLPNAKFGAISKHG
jgi:hypothetical protein